jgi:signal transduction histidine kinase
LRALRRRSADEQREDYVHRIVSLEKYIVLPARVALIVSCALFLWPVLVGDIGGKELAASGAGPSAAVLSVFKWVLGGYTALCVAYWLYLFVLARGVHGQILTKTAVFILAVADNLFLGVLVNAAMIVAPGEYYLLGGGPEAILFWAYCALMARNAILFSEAVPAVSLAAVYLGGYIGAILINLLLLQDRPREVPAVTDAEERMLVFRALVLGLITLCASAIYHLVQRRRRELDEAHERAIRSQRLDMAGMLAAQVAHELKNPLSIMTNAAFLMRRGEAGADPKLAEQIDILEEEIARADHIVRQLLDYARLAEGRIEAVLVNDCVDESLAGLRNEIESRNLVIEKHYAFDIPFLFIDPSQLRQVFSNILLNACEAMDHGGKITVSTSYSTTGFIHVSIADTGKGMEPDVLANIFKAFYTTKDQGTGMGLSIVQNVVRAYNGEIVPESEPGKGTVFHLRFPTRMAAKLGKTATQAGQTRSAIAPAPGTAAT